jgi:hypothetical protein
MILFQFIKFVQKFHQSDKTITFDKKCHFDFKEKVKRNSGEKKRSRLLSVRSLETTESEM